VVAVPAKRELVRLPPAVFAFTLRHKPGQAQENFVTLGSDGL
jgi:hypothetical protein